MFYRLNSLYATLIIFCFAYSVLLSIGVLGFGDDFYAVYSRPNFYQGGLWDRLGYLISTLTILDLKIGVFSVAFLLSFSLGYFLLSDRVLCRNGGIFYLVFVPLLFSWPIILSILNAMRQGVLLSIYFFALGYFIRTNKISLRLIALGLVSHKSGVFFFIPMFLFGKMSTINKYFILILSIICCLFLYFFLVSVDYLGTRESYGFSLSNQFLFSTLAIASFTFLQKSKFILNYIVFYSIVLTAFYLSDFTIHYERLWMLFMIPYAVLFIRVFLSCNRIGLYFLFSYFSFFVTVFFGVYNRALS